MGDEFREIRKRMNGGALVSRAFRMIKALCFFILVSAPRAFAQDAVLDLWNGSTPNMKSGAENVEEVVIDDPT